MNDWYFVQQIEKLDAWMFVILGAAIVGSIISLYRTWSKQDGDETNDTSNDDKNSGGDAKE